MKLDADTALDELARMTQVIEEDARLRRWFSTLDQLSLVERRNEVLHMCEQMTADGAAPHLIDCVRLLADERVFQAVAQVLRDRRASGCFGASSEARRPPKWMIFLLIGLGILFLALILF